MPTLLKAKGLGTYKNELNNTDGWQEILDNWVIDEPEVLQSRRGQNDFGTSFGNASDRAKQLLVYKDRILRHYNSTLQFDSDGSGTFQSFSGTFNEVVSNLRIKYAETKGNLFFTTDNGIKKISAATANDFTTASGYITNAGGVKAVDMLAELNISSGGFLPAQSKVAYRLVWGINDVNNNLILGSPSARFVLENTSSDINIAESFSIDFTTASETDVAGNYILFSSNTTDYFIWFSNTSNTTAPQTSETLARTALEVDVDGFGASTTNIINATANVIAQQTAFSVQISGTSVIVTSTESGNNLTDAAAQSGGITNVTVTVDVQGSVTIGSSANTQITFTVPSEITTTDYFYQLYRTAVVTTSEGITLDDLDPGDEMNLVYEQGITSAEISAGEVTFEDIVPDSFRASGAYLYTNPNTGEGILQSNEKPPIAQDIALFNNTLFYGNTKGPHRKQINLLSVNNITSGTSQFIIGNSTTTRQYTFVGDQEETNITTDTYANTTANSIILLNSASNTRKYYVWFDKGSGTDPVVTGRIGIRVDISDDTTASDISLTLTNAINLISDFTATDNGGNVDIVNTLNGNSDDVTFGSTPPGGSWAITITTQGDGEDSSNNDVLLSNNASIGQAIDESARSLVRVINKDSSSPVNAFYLTGPDDLPGLILFEARSLEDDTIYFATNDSNIVDNFSPSIPVLESLTAISINNPTEITAAGHGLTTGDSIYIYGTDSTPALLGSYVVTVLDTNTFTVPVNVTSAGTTGSWFVANVYSDNEEYKNRLFFSKTDQPEAVPLVNYIDIGPRDETIDRVIALRDNLFVLKSDGIYLVSGTSSPFRAQLLDSSTKIIAPDTAVVLNNLIYALSTQGVVTISESGVSIISRPIEDKISSVTRKNFPFSTLSFGIAYETDRAYIIFLPTLSTDTVATQAYRYNVFTRTWSRWTLSATCGLVNDEVDLLYLGDGSRNYVSQERKSGDRTDYADRDFDLTIGSSAITGSTITVSSAADLEMGDVIVQNQYVSISVINRLLLKLDLDSGLDDSDYFSTLSPSAGDDLSTVLDNINTKLVADDSSGTITSRSFPSTFLGMQTDFNAMIAELNNNACDTSFKNYKEATLLIPIEGIIQSVDISNNKITLIRALPYAVGTITAYKRINKTMLYAPQHFGDPSSTKQVREGTVIFEQNNFTNAILSYNSDLSANFDSINFDGRGVGFFGSNFYGTVTFGGEGSEVPVRTLIPRNKQRCRHLRIKFQHYNAREDIKILGISLEPRLLSKRGYR